MRKLITIVGSLCVLIVGWAQPAMDFNMTDCSTNTMHHLYTDYLDNEEVVIIEYFMTCSSCIEVGQSITPMYNQLSIDYPGQVNFFAFNFSDDIDCSVANNFVTTFGINAVPFDSGAAQLAYYGSFGMPSVVIVGGSQHEILYYGKTYEETSDTAAMDSTIRYFFTHLGNEGEQDLKMNIYPNPAIDFVQIDFENINGDPYKLIVENLSGQVLKEINIPTGNSGVNKYQLPTFDLSNGIYLLKLEINGNRGVVYKKININH